MYDALARELSEETALAYAGTVAHAYGVHYLVPGLAVAPAQPKHGGGGALYVLLRRQR